MLTCFNVQKDTLFSKYCTLLLVLYAPPLKRLVFYKAPPPWEAQSALIGQLAQSIVINEPF